MPLTPTDIPLFAQAEGVVRRTFQWGGIQENTDWILPVAACVAAALLVRVLYRRDAVELPRPVGWMLTLLRTAVFLALLILYLEPQWRIEREQVIHSRALLLVDTSLSMGLADGGNPGPGGGESRIDQVVHTLGQSDLIDQLRRKHDVVVAQFGEGLARDRFCTFEKLPPETRASDGNAPDSPTATAAGDRAIFDWKHFLTPSGTSTQLGTALRQLLDEEGGTPLSGVVVFSDGCQNAGPPPESAMPMAQRAEVPIFTVGLGSDRLPTNVRVADLVVPARAYPGDGYTVTGYLQAEGLAGRTVEVQLLSRESEDNAGQPGSGQVLKQTQATLGADGEVLPVKFEIEPDETGRRTLTFRVEAPSGDHNPADNLREADIEIVDRRNRVLLVAGGPTREYRFLRTMLHRDRSTTVDVLLQTAQPGISQEADKLLDAFPATREELFAYDAIVAFDPDWQAIGAAGVELLETWVAEQGGGLVLIAGPIHTARGINGWTEDAAMAPVRALYPVEFQRRFSSIGGGSDTSDEPWPLELTREGLEAEYLWLADTATASREAWASFEGVYSYTPVRGAKPGATVLARFSDPRTGSLDNQPVYFASQFYGSGRVFYLGSGEMWRLRKLDTAWFDQFYTKLIRHVSQGRLLRGSSRGTLLVGQDRYLLGDTVEVRAQLTNARLEPLESPRVAVQVVLPDGSVDSVLLEPNPNRPGAYMGRFPVLSEGSYRLELPVPESTDQRLSRRIQVKVPDLEREKPRRNDALLSMLARQTDGRYYVGVGELLQAKAESSLPALLKDRTKTMILTAPPDPLWEQQWLKWMMLGLCGLLCFEWLIRRLFKLA